MSACVVEIDRMLLLYRRRGEKASFRFGSGFLPRKNALRPSGINLDAGKEAHQESKGDLNSRRIVSISNKGGNQKQWKETT